MANKIILQKGDSIIFLDYIIKNSSNGDGLVLMKQRDRFGFKSYERHLGNFGAGDQESIDHAKIAAIVHFMIARPEEFSATLYYRTMGRGGQYHEYSLFKEVVLRLGIKLPDDITPGGGMNSQVYYKGEPLIYERSYSEQ